MGERGRQAVPDQRFHRVNPAYFEYADRRIKHLVDSGIVPAIVGGWGRGDCNGMMLAGVDGIKRHWRNLIARYGAYPDGLDHRRRIGRPAVDRGGPLRPEDRPLSPSLHDPSVPVGPAIRYRRDGHRLRHAPDGPRRLGRGPGAIPQVQAAYARKPPMPVVIGEYCYEGHMQTAFQDVQRYVFWGSMLSGSAGHTYGAAGVWHASVEGDPGIADVYDLTTWKEGMQLPRFDPAWAGQETAGAISLGELRAASGMGGRRLLRRRHSGRGAVRLPASARRLQLERIGGQAA